MALKKNIASYIQIFKNIQNVLYTVLYTHKIKSHNWSIDLTLTWIDIIEEIYWIFSTYEYSNSLLSAS